MQIFSIVLVLTLAAFVIAKSSESSEECSGKDSSEIRAETESKPDKASRINSRHRGIKHPRHPPRLIKSTTAPTLPSKASTAPTLPSKASTAPTLPSKASTARTLPSKASTAPTLPSKASTASNMPNKASTASTRSEAASTPSSTTTTTSPSSLQYTIPVTDADKAAAVQCHNNYRSQLAMGNAFNKTGGNKMQKASSMRKMAWDDGLAKLAAEWANQCTISHSNNGWAGENLYMNGGTFTNKDAFVLACDLWWSELAQYGFSGDLILYSANFAGIGHWTQMAWYNTDRIGCAMAKNCPNTNWKTYVVCWYYLGGNYIGAPVYSAGEPCSKCNAGDKCDKAIGLCYQ